MRFINNILYIGIMVSLVSAQVAEQSTQINPDTLVTTLNWEDSSQLSERKSSQNSNSFIEIESIFGTTIESENVNNDYVVPTFIKDERSFPQQDKYIDPLKDSSSLVQLDSFPDTINSGILVLRRQFAPSEYSLYLGKMSEFAKTKQSNFFIYNFPENFSLKNNAVLKFYDEKVINPNSDIVDVYFDNNHIYIPKFSKIYYHSDTTWKMITALNAVVIKKKTTGDVSITSNPVGASIQIDGKATSSVTPYLLSGMKPGNYRVSVVLKDYEKALKTVTVKADTVKQVNFNLKSTIGLENKFFINALFDLDYFVNIFTQKSDDKMTTQLEQDPTVVDLQVPANGFEFSGTVQLGYRIHNIFWINGQLAFTRTKPSEYQFVKDTGTLTSFYQKNNNKKTISIFSGAIGLGVDIIRTPVYRLQLSFLPSYAYLISNITGQDSSVSETPVFGSSNNILYKDIDGTVIKSESELRGSSFGYDLFIDNRFFVIQKMCIILQVAINSLFSLPLNGKATYTQKEFSSSYLLGDVQPVFSSWTENYVDKSTVEFSRVQIRMGIGYYF